MQKGNKKQQEKGAIEKFLELYTSKNTIDAYKLALKHYFEVLNIEPNQYFKEKRNYEGDIKKFFIEVKNKPPKTIRLYLSVIRTFLSENDIDLPEKFWRRLKHKINGSRALTIDIVPSNEELRSILTHMDAKGNALFLTMASSGMRIGETLQLKISDINLDKNPAKINISGKYTKSGNSRKAFISQEAKESIKEWLKIRKDYLKSSVGRSRYKKSADDDRIFPFLDATALYIWNNAVKKSGLYEKDENTNRNKLHPHVLRKFFRSQMGAVIPIDITEALMGHEGYLTEVYRKYSEDQLVEFYLKGENSITVFTNGIQQFKREMNTKMENYDELINRQALEIERLKSELAKLERSKEKQLGNELVKALENPEIANKIIDSLSEIWEKRKQKQ